MIWPSRREVRIWDLFRSKKSDKPTEPDRPVMEYVGFNIQRLLGIDPPTFEPSASATASGWKIKWEPCPQQQSGFDCGISVLVAATFYATGHEIPSFWLMTCGGGYCWPSLQEMCSCYRRWRSYPNPSARCLQSPISN